LSGPSCLYFGSVIHRRLGAKPHRFRYRLFWLYVDLDDLDGLDARHRLFSHNGFNLFSLYDCDHGNGSTADLKAQALASLKAKGVDVEVGAIRLLGLPRTLGYAFNPLSVYFCYSLDGDLAALIYEVHNTFGGRHSYVLRAELQGGVARHACEKTFFVSPFLPMGLRYEFHVSPPGESIAVAIRASGADGVVLRAAFAGERRTLTDWGLICAAVAFPLAAIKTIIAIHWEALRLTLKGARYRGPGWAQAAQREGRRQGEAVALARQSGIGERRADSIL
jgi:DUF1365 family protein